MKKERTLRENRRAPTLWRERREDKREERGGEERGGDEKGERREERRERGKDKEREEGRKRKLNPWLDGHDTTATGFQVQFGGDLHGLGKIPRHIGIA